MRAGSLGGGFTARRREICPINSLALKYFSSMAILERQNYFPPDVAGFSGKSGHGAETILNIFRRMGGKYPKYTTRYCVRYRLWGS
jgi:ABC-type phosphate transport system ATPase subunit